MECKKVAFSAVFAYIDGSNTDGHTSVPVWVTVYFDP
jgi:hypothetical protein